ncbi:MAG: RNA polymerase sigma factor [Anaerolineae bacterium]
MDRQHEQELIRKAQAGDRAAFGALYRACADKIYRYVFYRIGNRESAEDLTAEVFLKMIEGLPSYQDRQIPLMVWLYRIAHARVVDFYRRSKRSVRDIAIDAPETRELGDEMDLDASLLEGYRAGQVRQALLMLTESQAQVLQHRFFEGLNLEQTAQAMGKTIDAVKALQYRALQALAQALKDQGFQR